jgi:hypothetical protein
MGLLPHLQQQMPQEQGGMGPMGMMGLLPLLQQQGMLPNMNQGALQAMNQGGMGGAQGLMQMLRMMGGGQ